MSKKEAWKKISSGKNGITRKEFDRLCDDMGFWFGDLALARIDDAELDEAVKVHFGFNPKWDHNRYYEEMVG